MHNQVNFNRRLKHCDLRGSLRVVDLCVLCVSVPIIHFDIEKGTQYYSMRFKMPWYCIFTNDKKKNTEVTKNPWRTRS